MRPHVRSLLTLLSLSAVAIASPALAQSAAQRDEPQPTGTARITGRVLARDNGAPVRRAHVSLSGVPAAVRTGAKHAYVQREVETDDYGAFAFAGLPAGSYNLSVQPTNGFLGLPRARPAMVGEGRALDVPIRLERTGAIVGRIAAGNGEGLLGVEVQALRKTDFRGHVTVMPAARASTDDRGQYRLFNLSPGDYYVVATPGHSLGDRATTRRSGFVTTYHPGAQALRDAKLLVVRSGKDTTKVDVALASGPLARVAIDAVDSRGVPLGREASAILTLLGDVYLSNSMRLASRQDDGPLVFSGVPWGDYYLIVGTSYRQEEAAYVNVTVDGDVTLKVQTNSGARLSGRVVVQGPPRDTNSGQPFPNVTVTATRPPGKVRPVLREGAVGSTARSGQIRVDWTARSDDPPRADERGFTRVDRPREWR